MNKEYTRIGDKVIVTDENSNQRVLNYSDNTDEILVQENLISTIQNEIGKIQETLNKKEIEKNYFPSKLIKGSLLSLLTLPILFIITGNSHMLFELTHTIIGEISFLKFFTITISVPGIIISAILEFDHLMEHIFTKYESKGNKSKLEYLYKQLSIEEEKLEKLKANEEEVIEDIEIIPVNDKDKLYALREYLRLYEDIGVNEKKYLDYYENGILEINLSPNYSDNEINEAKKYFKEKTLSLKNNQK